MNLSIYYIIDTGHNHHAQFHTSWAGDHAHNYKDIWHSESSWASNDYVSAPNNFGSGRFDHDNVCHQFTRTTFSAGGHNHLVDGDTSNNQAQLTYTGRNKPFDNRPAYTVVQYIIYIQN